MSGQLRSETCLSESRLNKALLDNRSEMLQLLRDSIGIASLSGQEGQFVRFIHNWAQQHRFETDLWESSESQLAQYAEASQPHIPLAGRPSLVLRLPGQGDGRSLIFNVHADVVPPGEARNWSVEPWGGEYRDGRVYGRGACDAKGALIGAIWAMLVIQQNFQSNLSGDILLELIPGEEDCVGIGTLTSVARGYRADAAIILEPTENLPRCASRSGVRFEITCYGKAAHGTAKWLSRDAIGMMRKILDALEMLEHSWNESITDPLFAGYPIARPITVDSVQGGQWRGMVCDLCRCCGYLELLPGDDRGEWKRRFAESLLAQAGQNEIDVRFNEEYRGHRTAADDPLCAAAEAVVKENMHNKQMTGLNWKGWSGFNSGCEAGLRASVHGTPTLIWGPGSLAQAHAADEFVNFQDVEVFAGLLVRLAANWSHLPGGK